MQERFLPHLFPQPTAHRLLQQPPSGHWDPQTQSPCPAGAPTQELGGPRLLWPSSLERTNSCFQVGQDVPMGSHSAPYIGPYWDRDIYPAPHLEPEEERRGSENRGWLGPAVQMTWQFLNSSHGMLGPVQHHGTRPAISSLHIFRRGQRPLTTQITKISNREHPWLAGLLKKGYLCSEVRG